MLPIALSMHLGQAHGVDAWGRFGVVFGQITITDSTEIRGELILTLVLLLLFCSFHSQLGESRVEGCYLVLLLNGTSLIGSRSG